MGLSRLGKKCRECEYVDTCSHKRMEALAYIAEATDSTRASTIAAVLQPHNYRDIKIDVNTTVTIDLDEIKKKINESIYPNYLKHNGLL